MVDRYWWSRIKRSAGRCVGSKRSENSTVPITGLLCCSWRVWSLNQPQLAPSLTIGFVIIYSHRNMNACHRWDSIDIPPPPPEQCTTLPPTTSRDSFSRCCPTGRKIGNMTHWGIIAEELLLVQNVRLSAVYVTSVVNEGVKDAEER